MFWWKKKKQIQSGEPQLVAAEKKHNIRDKASAAPPAHDLGKTIQPLAVLDVMDNFLVHNPSSTPFSVHALIEAGATELMTSGEVLEVCEKIQHHGHPYPLNPTLQRELQPSELLSFLRWQSAANIPFEAYQNENTIRELIARFRDAASY